MHNPLEKALRTQLENIVRAARECAETGAREAVEALGVADANAPAHLSKEERELRVRLRAHARQLGDALSEDSRQGVSSLVEEIAYEHWHRMLFARFLAENGLLLYDGIAITLEDCRELAEELHFASPWELAANCAAKMLPQIFRLDSPSFELVFAPDRIRALERLLDSIDPATFAASDALGWLYQFWQTRKKKEINESEVKIGAKELPAVTQLFTEPYMVSFLLDNSLGAWYAAPKLAGKVFDTEAEAKADVATPAIPLTYLRLVQAEDKSWTPAGGAFEKWPADLKDFTLLDPCCGSGHFLVASFLMLVPMRMEREGLDARTAVDKVLTENIHGLELDQRCVELAAFALALEAWRYPDAGGYRVLPSFHLACDGIAPQMKREEWLRLARAAARNLPAAGTDLIPDDNPSLWESQLLTTMEKLYDTFENAPVLGSLINPEHLAGDLLQADFADVAKILHDNLSNSNAEAKEAVIAAHGIIKAMELLSKKYTLVITNPPYLGRGKQSAFLQKFNEKYFDIGKSDLATTMFLRSFDFLSPNGSISLVVPQNWLFQSTYKKFRKHILTNFHISGLARLGEHGFESTDAAGAFVILISIQKILPTLASALFDIDLTEIPSSTEKKDSIEHQIIGKYLQQDFLRNSNNIFSFGQQKNAAKLSDFVDAYQGIKSGDDPRLKRLFWETKLSCRWKLIDGGLSSISQLGYCYILDWGCDGRNMSRLQGIPAFSSNGFVATNVRKIIPYRHMATPFSSEITAIIPKDTKLINALGSFIFSPEYSKAIRSIDQNLAVATASFTKVPFDLDYWTKVAAEKYPHGLPEPFTDDPTQWIFHGHPCASVVWDEETKRLKIGADRIDATVLHIAVARLLGYRWPAELDLEMALAPEMREVMKRLDALHPFADDDGIVCIPALRQEQDAATRLLSLLVAAYGDSWNGTISDQLLAACGCEGKSLEQWLRDKFFFQHAKLFGDRPFIWQIWDGLRDGFSVLVNYHKLDNRLLNTLIYSYLGDWINKQNDDIANGVDGAQEKLDAAKALKAKLIAILEGESPYDIFVRWKPLAEQPVGWDPDLNDGVRLNIRPFVTAGVLREKPPKLNIKWEKDRGKDVASAPWYNVFHGDRINDHHLTLAEKKNK